MFSTVPGPFFVHRTSCFRFAGARRFWLFKTSFLYPAKAGPPLFFIPVFFFLSGAVYRYCGPHFEIADPARYVDASALAREADAPGPTPYTRILIAGQSFISSDTTLRELQRL